jgi:ligand-binding sensor domain-containing protein/signal transduction histidine kinase/CheY-like chemotaxis protein/AraC-like DNA-binding protein
MNRFLHFSILRVLSLTFGLSLSVLLTFAQTPHYTFDHLTLDEGLSQSTIFAIAKDSKGFMWFGTRDGLNRYDARNFKVYRNNPDDPTSLSGNTIQCFFIDKKMQLWIGTSDGISIYNSAQDNFIQSKPTPEITDRLSANHVTAIAQDSEGVIWVATYGGLNRVVSQNPLKYQHFAHDKNKPNSLLNDEIRTLYLDRDGALWIGTSLGVSRLTKSDDGGIQFVNFKLPSRQLKGTSWINCLAEDDQGNLLIGTEYDGIKLLDKRTGAISSLILSDLANRPVESVRVIQRNGLHEFWFGTIDGLLIYDQKKKTVVALRNKPDDNTSLADNSVRSIYFDPSGTRWVGTFYGGVNSYSPFARQFGEVNITNTRNQKAYKVAGAMVTDKNSNLWIGTDGNGLYNLNSKGETIRQYKHNVNEPYSLSHNKVKSMLLEENGLWIGTLGGLNFLDFSTGRMKHYFNDPSDAQSISDDRIYDIKKDSDGNIWIATYRGGLCRFDKKTHKFERYRHDAAHQSSLSSDGTTYIHQDADRNLWIGTIEGLNKMPAGKTTFEHFNDEGDGNAKTKGDYILCIYEDRKKNLWIGTRDAGLKVKFKKSGKLRQFTLEHGLPGNNVSGIQEDRKGNLWISTDNGLSRLNPETMAFKNYNKSDGLACKEFNFNSFHKDTNGNLYFGGYNGIVKFHPDSIQENVRPPQMAFTKLKLFNKEVPIDPSAEDVLRKNISHNPSLSFNYRQNVFSVEFAALSFINHGKNQYAYKLEGFEDQWNYVSEPVATYMNLQPGYYTLLAKASNNDGYWTKVPIRLQIHVLPPPWKTWWAYTIYTVIILGLVLALIHFSKLRWKLSHDLKIKELEKEQQDKLHLAKLNFFTNVAHEIRTPLTLIVSPIELVEEQYPKDDFIQRQLRIVKTNTSRLMRLINQLLDFQKQEAGNFRLKPETGNLVELLREIVFSFTEYAHSRQVQLNFRTDSDKIEFPFDRDELEKVFCNLLHNAFKFTPGGGSIAVSMRTEVSGDVAASFARIIIEDNGIGIATEDLPRIFNRFFQVDHHHSSESGFGIGLALTRGIIQLHGGSIQVESREANMSQSGFTRFIILLPLEGPERQPTTKTVTSEETNHVFHTPGFLESKGTKAGQPVILVVEDNAEIRTCLTEILHPHYHVIQACDGEDAWAIAQEKLPDLIISDIAMARMDGLEFTEHVKNDERTNHIPIILLTARGSTMHHVEGIESGADDYITKPFHSQILLGKVRNLIASREVLKAKYNRLISLEPAQEEVEDPEDKFILRLRDILEANLTDPDFNVSKLVREIGMSRSVLFRKIKVHTGLSVIDLIRSTRLKKAEKLLRQKKMSISEVAFAVGFNDPKYFSKSFRSQFGKTPTEYMESAQS